MKHAKKRISSKRQIVFLGKARPSFAKLLMSMPNVGLDTDFARSNAVDEMRQFMRDRAAESTKGAVDLKELLDEGRA